VQAGREVALQLLVPKALVFHAPALAVHAQAIGPVVRPAQAKQFRKDFAQAIPSLTRIAGLIEQRFGDAGKFGSQNGGQAMTDFQLISLVIEIVGALDEAAHEVAGVLVALPFAKAALSPLAEVLLVERPAREIGFEDLLDFGQGIEPFDQSCSIRAILKAAIKLTTKDLRQPRNFSSSSHNFILL
jgi:hypothetical protein